jgi:hypothetical protein
MSEKTFTPESVAKASSTLAKMPEPRQKWLESTDSKGVELYPLTKTEQKLAHLDPEISAILFAKLAEKGISAL